jgi:hypothetical protein
MYIAAPRLLLKREILFYKNRPPEGVGTTGGLIHGEITKISPAKENFGQTLQPTPVKHRSLKLRKDLCRSNDHR